MNVPLIVENKSIYMIHFKKKFYYIFSIVIFIGLNACAYNKGENPAPVNKSVSYLKDVKPILVTHCFKCHTDTSTNPNRPGYAFFNNFSEIQKYALRASISNPNYSVLVARLKHLESPGMPYQEAPMVDTLIQKIQDWVLFGAPNN
jgi:hypothetical protein